MDLASSAPHSITRPERPRDAALDLLRAVALCRVLLWHAFAAPWMTFFAAMPVMFFVAGTLLGSSFENVSHRALLRRRVRRLLIPLWVYGAVVGAAGLLHQPLAWPAPELLAAGFGHAVSWVVPLVDPAGAGWHGGWLSTHLWYLRAYLWILLLFPLLAMLARRPTRSLPFLALAILAVEAVGNAGVPVVGRGPARVLLGDAATYGLFVVLGIIYRRRRSHFQRSSLAAGSAVAVVVSMVYVAVAGVPAGGVNESYAAIALTGLAWLLAGGAAEGPIRTLAERRRVRRLTELVSRRAVTIYLWHPAAIVFAYATLKGSDRFPRMSVILHWPVPAVMVVALTVTLTALAVGALGWVEDLSARRPRRDRAPNRPTAGGRRVRIRVVRLAAIVPPAAAALALVVPTIVMPVADGGTAGAASIFTAPRPPSFRAALANEAFSRRISTSELASLGRVDVSAGGLTAAIDRWLAGQSDVDAVAVGVAVNGQVWAGAANKPAADNRLRADDGFGALSMTKTFTTALVLQEVAANRLSLDAPVPPVSGVHPSGDAARITVRQLLDHSSGLIDYTAVPGYDASRPLSPREAVQLAMAAGLQSKPGAEVHYTNTNFLYLGLVVEETSGRSYRELLSELATVHGLQRTTLGPGRAGWPGFSSGGVISTVGDLARWGDALFTPGRALDVGQAPQIVTLDDKNMALSMWPVCPCGTGPDGTKQFSAIGQFVGYGGLFHFPGGMTLAVRFDRNPEPLDGLVVSLGQALEKALWGTPVAARR